MLRRVGGYNLDAFVDPSRPIDLTRIMIGSEGTLGFIVDAKIELVPLPKQKAVLTIEFDELLDALGATPAILKHGPSAVEVMDDFILSHAKSHPALDRAAAGDDQRRRIGAALRGVLRRPVDELKTRMAALERDLGVGCSRDRCGRCSIRRRNRRSGVSARPRLACPRR